jgi:hypothetical protein
MELDTKMDVADTKDACSGVRENEQQPGSTCLAIEM